LTHKEWYCVGSGLYQMMWPNGDKTYVGQNDLILSTCIEGISYRLRKSITT